MVLHQILTRRWWRELLGRKFGRHYRKNRDAARALVEAGDPRPGWLIETEMWAEDLTNEYREEKLKDGGFG